MRVSRKFLFVAALGAAVGYVAQQAHAGPAPLAPRGAFVLIVPLNAGMAGDCGPLGPMEIGTGIDATSPFFHFAVDQGGIKNTYTYRPRADDCGSCNVRYFGDGGIAAVADFRTMYERWKRSTHPVVGPGGGMVCPLNGVSIGGGNGCTAPCIVPLVLTPRDIMTSPVGPGTGGALLFIVIDPATNTFEDYKFEYSVYT